MANQVDRSSTIQGYRRSKDSQRYPPTAPPSLVSSVHITPGGTPSVSPRIKDCASNTTTAIKSSSSQPVKERQILSSSVRPAVASTADIGPRSCPTKTPDEHIAGAISILLPIRAPLSDITLTPDPEAREFEFRHCNECEDGNPDYKGCNHPDDPASFSPLPADNTLFDPYAISTTTVVLHDHARFDRPLYLLDFYEMIRTHALAALFTENLEKDSDTVNGILYVHPLQTAYFSSHTTNNPLQPLHRKRPPRRQRQPYPQHHREESRLPRRPHLARQRRRPAWRGPHQSRSHPTPAHFETNRRARRPELEAHGL